MDWALEAWDGGAGVSLATGVATAWSWALAGEFVLLLVLAILVGQATRSSRFWCSAARRLVEVEFEQGGLPGRRSPTAVVSCSAFCPPTAVTCNQPCLRADFRRRPGRHALPA